MRSAGEYSGSDPDAGSDELREHQESFVSSSTLGDEVKYSTRLAALAGSAALIAMTLAPVALATGARASTGAQAAPAGWTTSLIAVNRQGGSVLATAGLPAAATVPDAPPAPHDAGAFFHGVDNGTQAHLPTPTAAAVSLTPVGFDGLSQLDQARADGGHQRAIGAPDQALCVGNGYVLEGVNNALRVFGTDGAALTDPIALAPFFGDGHEIVSTSPLVLGALHTDPRCLFDPDTGRFFVTDLRYHRDPQTLAVTGPYAVELAVSQGGDPRAGWSLYTIDTTADGSDGSTALSGCPCLGDQPELGADANGIYVTTTEYAHPDSSNETIAGERWFAMSKARLVTGSITRAVSFSLAFAGTFPFPVNTEPAIIPTGGDYDSDNGGTEYLTSDCGSVDQLFVFALTNTSSLDSEAPQLALSSRLVQTEHTTTAAAFGQPDGARPLASWIQQQTGGNIPPVEYLDSGSPCGNTVYADHRLWTTRVTDVKPENGPVRAGIAWFQLLPTVTDGEVSATVAKQGYLAPNRNNAILGSFAVDSNGHGVLAFSVYGPDYYPSVAYAPVDETGVGNVVIVAAGSRSLDDYDGYAYFGATNRVARFGDYSAAVTTGDGDYWIAGEYQPDTARTLMASWATHLAHLSRGAP